MVDIRSNAWSMVAKTRAAYAIAFAWGIRRETVAKLYFVRARMWICWGWGWGMGMEMGMGILLYYYSSSRSMDTNIQLDW